jgi:hypothetical protein
LAGIGEREVFENRTTLVILAAMALLAFVCFVTLGPLVVAHAAPVWWLAEQTGWRLTRAEARWEVVQITGWVAIAASRLMLVALGMAFRSKELGGPSWEPRRCSASFRRSGF